MYSREGFIRLPYWNLLSRPLSGPKRFPSTVLDQMKMIPFLRRNKGFNALFASWHKYVTISEVVQL